MKQVVQPLSGGGIQVIEVPPPSAGPTEVLVGTAASLISPGTEGSVTHLARSSLVAKAKARPDLVRQVIKKAKTEGIASTVRSVRSRLDEYLPLGYSASGVALEVGEAVSGVRPGQRVATGGAGKANHAEFQAVPGLLTVPIPEGIDDTSASFATIGAIALHGLHLAELQAGSNVVVLGLGLVGQLTARIAKASGHRVFGIDVSDFPLSFAQKAGVRAVTDAGEDTTRSVLDWSNGRGADAVIITAGGKSSDAVTRTPELCRDRATVVVVGDVGLDLQRTPFYEKELTLRFARSYGPGRYERSYEDWAVDYPEGYVRWTEGRNLQAVLQLIADGSLVVDDLITHRFDIADALQAYTLIEERSEPFLGILLTYPQVEPEREPIRIHPTRRTPSSPAVGLIGSGNFARAVLVPSMKKAGFERFVSVASASGISARRMAEKEGFEKVAAEAGEVIGDPEVDVVVIATPHHTHADLTIKALEAGKHVFCEKPLAITTEELDRVQGALTENSGILFSGFNRRSSRSIQLLKEHFGTVDGPIVITYIVNAGPVPSGHWYEDRKQGGRLLGEVCHFVDLCNHLVGTPARHVSATASGSREQMMPDRVIVGLTYPDGSLGAITYCSDGNRAMAKEQIDVMKGGRSGQISDFNSLVLDGRKIRLRSQDKGHVRHFQAFKRHVVEGLEEQAIGHISSMRTTLQAVEALVWAPTGLRKETPTNPRLP